MADSHDETEFFESTEKLLVDFYRHNREKLQQVFQLSQQKVKFSVSGFTGDERTSEQLDNYSISGVVETIFPTLGLIINDGQQRHYLPFYSNVGGIEMIQRERKVFYQTKKFAELACTHDLLDVQRLRYEQFGSADASAVDNELNEKYEYCEARSRKNPFLVFSTMIKPEFLPHVLGSIGDSSTSLEALLL